MLRCVAGCCTMTSAPSDSPVAAAIEEALQLLDRARTFVKEAETIGLDAFPTPAINEFRNVAYHLAAYVRSPEDLENINSALRHTKKAYLDANEAYAFALLYAVSRYDRAFRGFREIVSAHLPHYLDQQRALLHLRQQLSDHKMNSEEERFDRALALEGDFLTIRALLDDLETARGAIEDAIRKQKVAAWQWLIGILIAIVSAAIGWILALL